jgi:uncharacterized protein (DUF486 family)
MPENVQEDLLSAADLEIDGDTSQVLEIAVKWTRFIAVTMFILCGLGVLMFLMLGFNVMEFTDRFSFFGLLNSTSWPWLFFLILLLAALISSWFYFLWRFSNKIRQALYSQDQLSFEQGLSALKIYFIVSAIFSTLAILSNFLALFDQ